VCAPRSSCACQCVSRHVLKSGLNLIADALSTLRQSRGAQVRLCKRILFIMCLPPGHRRNGTAAAGNSLSDTAAMTVLLLAPLLRPQRAASTLLNDHVHHVMSNGTCLTVARNPKKEARRQKTYHPMPTRQPAVALAHGGTTCCFSRPCGATCCLSRPAAAAWRLFCSIPTTCRV
jgi:hypothetical protein